MIYRPVELHCHTRHSDGAFTPDALCRAAQAAGYAGIALTDHNTVSGLEEIDDDLTAATVPVIPGIEWTTFYGHLLVLGARRLVDWRWARPETIDDHLREIRDAQGVTGIAHPFEFGSPLCTGCYWDFKVRDWSLVDYLEVWSEPDPHGRLKNHLAFEWWTDLLNRGVRVTAVSGRDWHGPDAGPVRPAVTWLGLAGGTVTTGAVQDALRAGRSWVTLGPRLDVSLARAGRVYGLGDAVEPGPYVIAVSVTPPPPGGRVRLAGSAADPRDLPAAGEIALELRPGWARVEVDDEDGRLLAFTSAVYVRNIEKNARAP